MWRILRTRVEVTAETHRTTMYEIFFDLVFVFALIRVTEYMSAHASPLTLVKGLVVLLLLWISWLTYCWLGNHARADVGLIRAGTTAAMAAVFLAAVVVPDIWEAAALPRLVLLLSYLVLRVIHLVLYHRAAEDDQRLHRTLRIYTLITALSWIPLVLGAVLGGSAQLPLWTAALAIDFAGGLVASLLSGWPLRSPRHFVERHGLMVIIALGETLISVGAGIGTEMIRGPVLLAALFALVITVCLFQLYRVNSMAAGEELMREPSPRRDRLAVNAYSAIHFALVIGTIYLAFGVHQAIATLAHDEPSSAAGSRLAWTPAAALFGGAALYLAGRATFLGVALRSVPLAQLLAPVVALALVPAGRFLPGLFTLALLAAFLVVLVGYERVSGTGPDSHTADEVAMRRPR
ncbi:low temperature requirement protein A [Micromonospora sp. WMMD1082]|uniref:low temperature requirement protein A n=1 Tax=Micromonospora sp. WMMD1082 TaxID=3016104 RepID=UPI002416A756|nr:low temperature requirement protein A [Micromonospora sp. WMMD1082]MDG4797167.1 low temperature requirement protein A [Micromonospora sp. WMMD1082]